VLFGHPGLALGRDRRRCRQPIRGALSATGPHPGQRHQGPGVRLGRTKKKCDKASKLASQGLVRCVKSVQAIVAGGGHGRRKSFPVDELGKVYAACNDVRGPCAEVAAEAERLAAAVQSGTNVALSALMNRFGIESQPDAALECAGALRSRMARNLDVRTVTLRPRYRELRREHPAELVGRRRRQGGVQGPRAGGDDLVMGAGLRVPVIRGLPTDADWLVWLEGGVLAYAPWDKLEVAPE